jgi:thiamine phosphate synthase YjbQ (UPF0047 family)
VILLILRSANRKSVLELHNRTGEDACPEGSDRNAEAHLKRQITGRKAVGALRNGGLDSGTWEQMFCSEFDGRRRKRVLVNINGE